jgi:hypothetical protein
MKEQLYRYHSSNFMASELKEKFCVAFTHVNKKKQNSIFFSGRRPHHPDDGNKVGLRDLGVYKSSDAAVCPRKSYQIQTSGYFNL